MSVQHIIIIPDSNFNQLQHSRSGVMRIFFVLVFILSLKRIDSEPGKDCPTIKTKQKWGGTSASSVDYQLIPVNCVVIHHTATRKCDTFSTCVNILRSIQSYHKSIGCSDISYNFLIGNDGAVYEGTGWHKVGSHAGKHNKNCTGIAFIGDFQDVLPAQQALDVAKEFIKCGVELGELDPRYKLLAASQVKATISPGPSLAAEIRDWDNWSRL